MTCLQASQVLGRVYRRGELRGEEREGLSCLFLLVREEKLVYSTNFFLFHIRREALPVVKVWVIRDLKPFNLLLGDWAGRARQVTQLLLVRGKVEHLLGHRRFEFRLCFVDVFEDLGVDLEVHLENIALFNLALLPGLSDSHQCVQLGLFVHGWLLQKDALTLIFGQKLDRVVLSPLVSPVLTHDAVGVTSAHLDDLACEVHRQTKIDGGLQFEALLLGDAPPDTLLCWVSGGRRGLNCLWEWCLDGYLGRGIYRGHDLSWVDVVPHCCLF